MLLSLIALLLINAIYLTFIPQRTRRMREAEESGKRQAEEDRRLQYDEVFRQMANVHMESVDTYLEEIVLEARTAVADQQGERLYIWAYNPYYV